MQYGRSGQSWSHNRRNKCFLPLSTASLTRRCHEEDNDTNVFANWHASVMETVLCCVRGVARIDRQHISACLSISGYIILLAGIVYSATGSPGFFEISDTSSVWARSSETALLDCPSSWKEGQTHFSRMEKSKDGKTES
ncbi:uncharacterized protein BO72DRAFT_74929 [Aspergillus fijiensis CBS 313.89]|uniref:Uncharacterized protein n=1 Tax=Aspergillus fijiensis CBS 313.89 TaxID=1448319 RepID=A0A8G1RUD8_9EURO|nr:uncharacterized protein BO72DRAFT_74929 [Aspergillus fijiensis CBS 313.89]RAK78488.1 hypothetical protein BO72DRAFT_74929 [Aspergillus fijiensis CBS 313.89]